MTLDRERRLREAGLISGPTRRSGEVARCSQSPVAACGSPTAPSSGPPGVSVWSEREPLDRLRPGCGLTLSGPASQVLSERELARRGARVSVSARTRRKRSYPRVAAGTARTSTAFARHDGRIEEHAVEVELSDQGAGAPGEDHRGRRGQESFRNPEGREFLEPAEQTPHGSSTSALRRLSRLSERAVEKAGAGWLRLGPRALVFDHSPFAPT